MTRKPDDPRNPDKVGDGSDMDHRAPGMGISENRAQILSMTSSPAFDAWLEDQTKRLVKATETAPDARLIELIRNWPTQNHK